MKIKFYQDKRNPHKYIEVRMDGYGHYKAREIMRFDNGVINKLGDRELHRWKRNELADLLEDYEEYYSIRDFYDYIYAICSECGKEGFYIVSKKERKLIEAYKEDRLSGHREMGLIQELFPRVPAWIREGAINPFSNGMCTCPKCQKRMFGRR